MGENAGLLYFGSDFAQGSEAECQGLLSEAPRLGFESLPIMLALEILEPVHALPECKHESLEPLAQFRIAGHRRNNRRSIVSSSHPPVYRKRRLATETPG